MAKQVSISSDKPPFRSMDYDALYREGIELIQKFSGAVWTDYNVHDPGVTILEYLCFGITDVAFRCNFPITDLLYARENRQFKPVDNAFFPADKIFPCTPLTEDDYRRMILDRMMEEVDYVWVKPATNQREDFNGLYNIRLQLNEENNAQENHEKILKKVYHLWSAHRNLCEDIQSVTILKKELLEVEAIISINTDASAEQVLADLIHETEHFLTPRGRFYSFKELLAEGMDVDEILDGPEPVRGFIKTGELRSSVLYTSQIRDIIAAVSGVRNIEEVRVKLNSVPQYANEILVPDDSYITLSDNMRRVKNHPVQIWRNGRQVIPDEVIVRQILNAYAAREYQGFLHKADLKPDLPLVEKDLADIGAYYSIQRFFPTVYGIGAYGLPRDADFLRQAQARQLKGYLAIFEVMLAGYLKQLTQLRQLFSTGKETADAFKDENNEDTVPAPTQPQPAKGTGSTYFSQFPFDIPDIDALLEEKGPGFQQIIRQLLTEISVISDHTPEQRDEFMNHLISRYGKTFDSDLMAQMRASKNDFTRLREILVEARRSAVNRQLADYTAISDHALDRRNEFLDHLLARFGETFNSDLLKQLNTDGDDAARLKERLIEAKCRILREYDVLSRDRGKGFDYRKAGHISTQKMDWGETWVSNNVSGLKKRLCYWLNLEGFEDRGLTDYFPFHDFDLKMANPKTSSRKGALPLRAVLEKGRTAESYEIRQKSGDSDNWEVYFRGNASSEAPPMLRAENREEAETKLNTFLKMIKSFDAHSKGFFIVEHLLLRPLHTKGAKMVFSINLPGAKKTPARSAPPGPKKIEFRSPYFTQMEELNDLARDLLVIASNRSNFDILPVENQFVVLLKHKGEPLLVSELPYDRDTASQWCDDLAAYIDDARKNNPELVDQWIDFETESIKGLQVKNNFYTHRLSIVAPNWASIFIEQDFQILFENLVAQHMPAHLRVDFQWMNWTEMKRFESVYLLWLYEKSRDKINANAMDEHAFQLVEILTVDKTERDELKALAEAEKAQLLSKKVRNEALSAYFGKKN